MATNKRDSMGKIGGKREPERRAIGSYSHTFLSRRPEVKGVRNPGWRKAVKQDFLFFRQSMFDLVLAKLSQPG